MFSQLRRVPLRRCLHSQAPHTLPKTNTKSSRLAFTLAASATVITYSTWRWTTDQRIALDSATVTDSIKSPALDGPSSETHHTSSTTPITSTRSNSPKSSGSTPSTKTEPELSPKSKSEPKSSEAEAGAGADTQTEAEASEGDASDGASQGAYNPVTGEINWDCPCLGGMAHGPCGPEFREAFSCFVFSEEEPKGINCVEKFQGMQTCFRAHPEVYADEIMDDEEADGKASASDSEGAPAVAEAETNDATAVAPPTEQSSTLSSEATPAPPSTKKSKSPSSPQKSSA